MSKDRYKKGFTTFIMSQLIGLCPHCDKDVYNNQLYVEKDDNIYHYSCHNDIVKNKKNFD